MNNEFLPLFKLVRRLSHLGDCRLEISPRIIHEQRVLQVTLRSHVGLVSMDVDEMLLSRTLDPVEFIGQTLEREWRRRVEGSWPKHKPRRNEGHEG